MKEQLIVIDPNTGKVYEMGEWEDGIKILGEPTPNPQANGVEKKVTWDGESPLRPLPDTDPRVIKYKLGVNAYESVKPELRAQITGEYRRAYNELCADREEADGKYHWFKFSVYDRIILSPPAYEPKTDREMLEELVSSVNEYDWTRKAECIETITRAKTHLETTE